MIAAMRKNGLVLAVFALLATGLVAITNKLTEHKIAEQAELQLLGQLNQVIPTSMHDNDLYKSCTLVTAPNALGTDQPMPLYVATKGSKPTAMAIEAIAPNGYNGAIKVLVAADMNGKVTGARVLQHNETPGLGDKIDIRVTDWITHFAGKTIDSGNDKRWAVQKDGGQFDQFTGATITPRAVVGAVRDAAWYLHENKDTLTKQPFNCGGSKA
ncbi:electron transport complex subunit RsxG [Parasalinivibrio latis]|uniref:electron transport complex subunit RsxG n=1 Tax=Parasalinivibrio latis TaxID=2952610 RepID=UPI0030E2988F